MKKKNEKKKETIRNTENKSTDLKAEKKINFLLCKSKIKRGKKNQKI